MRWRLNSSESLFRTLALIFNLGMWGAFATMGLMGGPGAGDDAALVHSPQIWPMSLALYFASMNLLLGVALLSRYPRMATATLVSLGLFAFVFCS